MGSLAKVSFKPVTEIGTPPVGIGENRSETFEKVCETLVIIYSYFGNVLFPRK